MPAFAFRHVKELYPVFWAKSRELVEHLREASKSTVPKSESKGASGQDPEKSAADATVHAPGAVEVGGWSSRATLDIIGQAGMGKDFNALKDPNNKLNGHYQNVFNLGKSGKFWQILGFFVPFWILKNIPVNFRSYAFPITEYLLTTLVVRFNPMHSGRRLQDTCDSTQPECLKIPPKCTLLTRSSI
jgi:hypothetical protein